MKCYCCRLVLFILLILGQTGCGGGSEDVISISSTPLQSTAVTVQQTSPSNQEQGVEVDTSIGIELSVPINTEDIIFEVKERDSNNDVEGLLSSHGQKILFTLSNPLNYSSEYTVNISSKTITPQGLNDYSFTFETAVAQSVEKGSFHPPIRRTGNTKFTITPIESIKADTLTKISFGIPFPKGYLSDVDKFRLFDENGKEIAIAAKEILAWRTEGEESHSIRSALVQLELEFKANEYGLLSSRDFTLEWGLERTVDDLPLEPARNQWVLVDDEEFSATDNVYEPQAYALFQPYWYGDSVIKTRLLPLKHNSDFSAYETAFELFGDTAINQVDPRVSSDNLIPHRDSYATWLFDRAMAIYQLAFRTGEFNYLRAAHRAAQFYLQHINEDGYFILKPGNDMKYSYGESLVADFILFGDERITNTIKQMVPAWDTFNSDYKITSNFWTERHAAFQLKGYVTAYELTGDNLYKEKAKTTFSNLKRMQASPDDGVPITGALMHTASSHGEGGDKFIASPWMSALLVDAVERYNIHLEDESVSDFIIRMADFFQQEGIALYEWTGYGGKDRFFVPYYLAGSDLSDAEHGGIGANDLEHGIDVNKIFSSAYFHSCAVGTCNESYLPTISRLYTTAFTHTIPYWIRPAAPNSSLTSYRLAPPRKFNWWFNTTANNDFLLGKNVIFPKYQETEALLKLTQQQVEYSTYKPNDEIKFSFELVNIGTITAKNIVIEVSTLIESPKGLLEVSSISKSGANRSGEVVWHVESLEPNQRLTDFSFTVRVKDLPVLQTSKRPIGNIVSFGEVNYCNQTETIDKCPLWVNVWASGKQTLKTQSNWVSIKPIEPNTPPIIQIVSPLNFEILSGSHNTIAEIEDVDGVAVVQFMLDGELIETLDSPPYQTQIQFDSLSPDTHELIVSAWDVFGSEASESIIVEAKNPDTVAPTIAISSPENQKSYCDLVAIQYSVEDDFSIGNCEITLNNHSVIDDSCKGLELTSIIPLFHAEVYLPLEQPTELIENSNKPTLVGVLKGATWNTTTEQNSLSFSGIDDYVDFTTADLEINNNVTVSFWINPLSEEGMIMSQDWSYIGNEYGWAISMGANHHVDNNTLSVTWSSGTNASNLNGGNVIQTPAYSLSLNQWQHVVIRKQDKQVDIFINGTLITSEQLLYGNIAWPFTSEKKLNFGKAMVHPDMYNKNYHGLLDNIAIWNSALTDNEISQLHGGVSSNTMQQLVVSAEDNAGNKGTLGVNFAIKSCN